MGKPFVNCVKTALYPDPLQSCQYCWHSAPSRKNCSKLLFSSVHNIDVVQITCVITISENESPTYSTTSLTLKLMAFSDCVATKLSRSCGFVQRNKNNLFFVEMFCASFPYRQKSSSLFFMLYQQNIISVYCDCTESCFRSAIV